MTSRPAACVVVLVGLLDCKTSDPIDPSATPPTAASAPSAEAEAAAPDLPAELHLIGQVEAGGAMGYFAVPRHQDDGAYAGTLDIPMQLVEGLPLDDVSVTADRIGFARTPVKAVWLATIGEDGTLACSFEQAGVELPCTMQKVSAEQFAAAKAPRVRPQTPEPPFPYEAVEVEYDNAEAKVHLTGTLTLPRGEGKVPAVLLLISGSGAQARDEMIAGHKLFAVLADHPRHEGIGVLRVDDRGIGGSSKGNGPQTSDDFAGDVLAGVRFLAAHERIDPRRIGLVGHSEGGPIAPVVATRSKKVAFIVMMAGSGVPGGDVLVDQVGALMEAAGAPEAAVNEAKTRQRELMNLLVSGKPDAEIVAEMRERLLADGGKPAGVVEAQINRVMSPWYRHFVKFDPRPTLRKVKVPVLVLNGDLGRQVVAEQNVPAVVKALKKGGNHKVPVHRLDGLNHLFQHADTGGVDEYATIEESLAPEVLTIISDWILAL